MKIPFINSVFMSISTKKYIYLPLSVIKVIISCAVQSSHVTIGKEMLDVDLSD